MKVDGDFTWETVLGVEETGKADDKGASGKDKNPKTDKKASKDEVRQKWWKSKKTTDQDKLPSTRDDSKVTGDGETDSQDKQEPPFTLTNLQFEVPKGAFVAIVGRVGCGKVS